MLNDEIKQLANTHPDHAENDNDNIDSSMDDPFNIDEVMDSFKWIRTKSALGPDFISHHFIKHLPRCAVSLFMDCFTPLLFIIFINDVIDDIDDIEGNKKYKEFILMFADDIVCYREDRDELIEILTNIARWCYRWKMVINCISWLGMEMESKEVDLVSQIHVWYIGSIGIGIVYNILSSL